MKIYVFLEIMEEVWFESYKVIFDWNIKEIIEY